MSDRSIAWFDSKIDFIVQDTDFYPGVDKRCTFCLSPKTGNFAIIEVDNPTKEYGILRKSNHHKNQLRSLTG